MKSWSLSNFYKKQQILILKTYQFINVVNGVIRSYKTANIFIHKSYYSIFVFIFLYFSKSFLLWLQIHNLYNMAFRSTDLLSAVVNQGLVLLRNI